MKVIANRCVWVAYKEKKKLGKVSRSCRQRMDGIPFISQQQALKSQQAYIQSSCQLWKKFDVQCIVLLNVLAHMGL